MPILKWGLFKSVFNSLLSARQQECPKIIKLYGLFERAFSKFNVFTFFITRLVFFSNMKKSLLKFAKLFSFASSIEKPTTILLRLSVFISSFPEDNWPLT